MRTIFKDGWVYRAADRSFQKQDLICENGRILPAGCAGLSPEDIVIRASGLYVMPGLVDVHTHGCAGYDFVYADAGGLARMQTFYLSHGVTSVMPTLASGTPEEWGRAVTEIGKAGEGSIWRGIHFEGRYLNPAKRGAHASDRLSALNAGEATGFLQQVRGAKHMTAALELDDPEHTFLTAVLNSGATVSLGHTMADYATAEKLFDCGVTAVTHLFNAMPSLHHRSGGVVAAALTRKDVFCELIVDGLHIAPEVVRLTRELKGSKLVLITDSMEGTGCPDGEYRIAGEKVILRDGEARTEDGALAGSTLTLDLAVRNYMRFTGASLEEAWYSASLAPAQEVGLESIIGSLEPGKRADVVLLSCDGTPESLVCEAVYSGGRQTWAR